MGAGVQSRAVTVVVLALNEAENIRPWGGDSRRPGSRSGARNPYVDDGSDDASPAIFAELARELAPRFKCVRHRSRCGQSTGVWTGCATPAIPGSLPSTPMVRTIRPIFRNARRALRGRRSHPASGCRLASETARHLAETHLVARRESRAFGFLKETARRIPAVGSRSSAANCSSSCLISTTCTLPSRIDLASGR